MVYMIVYLINGNLPWMLERRPELASNLPNITKEQKYMIITKMKQSMTPKEITVGLPIEIEDLLFYTWSLKFTDRPDYNFIKKMFDAVIFRAQYKDFIFDWKLVHKKEALMN